MATRVHHKLWVLGLAFGAAVVGACAGGGGVGEPRTPDTKATHFVGSPSEDRATARGAGAAAARSDRGKGIGGGSEVANEAPAAGPRTPSVGDIAPRQPPPAPAPRNTGDPPPPTD